MEITTHIPPKEITCTKIKFEIYVPYPVPYKGKHFSALDDEEEEEIKAKAEQEAVNFIRDELGSFFAERATELTVDLVDFYAGYVQVDFVCSLKPFKVPLSG